MSLPVNFRLIIGAALGAFFAMLALLYIVDPAGHSSPQDAVRTGTDLASLDPEKTVSLFQIVVDGGVQEVVARDASDQEQVALIRAHLHRQAKKFSGGDFSDAANLHAEEMAWVADLKAGAEEIDVRYADLASGARIRYTATKPALVSALHSWLMAQAADRERQTPGR